ncbi:MAG: hypothetical protein AB1938_32395 [Myxococcota bacterium]
MTERVDKQWKDKGLSRYSTEAILGTLGHYGVALDEVGFKAAAATRFPMELAMEWKPRWKGTGQFAAFPYAAATELYARLLPDALPPSRAAQGLLEVIGAGARSLDGKEADLPGALSAMEELLPRLPPPGERRDVFLGEFVGYIEAWAKPFNELPTRLAAAGRRDEALRVAKINEALFLDREGCVTALVRAATGERDTVVAELKARVGDAAKDVYARYSALDALFTLGEHDLVKQQGLLVFDAAAAAQKWGLADTIAHLLGHLVQQVGADGAYVREVQARLELAHHHGGGHH